MSEILATSAELQKSFGRYRETALREPVVITHHGRESLVLLSVEEYRRLQRQDRRTLHPAELHPREVQRLSASEAAPEGGEFDHEYLP